jgi:hypothetical protein
MDRLLVICPSGQLVACGTAFSLLLVNRSSPHGLHSDVASLSTSSIIDLHPQSATVYLIAAKTRIAVTSGNGTSTGVN